MPSDFGAVLEYAMQLEASAPEADLAKLEAIRPAVMGPTKKQREELAKAAATHAVPAAQATAPDDKQREEAARAIAAADAEAARATHAPASSAHPPGSAAHTAADDKKREEEAARAADAKRK